MDNINMEMYISYSKLLEIFKDLSLDYQKEDNSSIYLPYIKKAFNLFNPLISSSYKKLSYQETDFSPSFQREFFRPISSRQSFCLIHGVSLLQKNLFTSAINELLDAFEDNETSFHKRFLSVNEYFLFYHALEEYYNKMTSF